MLTRREYTAAQARAAGMIRAAGIPITDEEAGRVEVADFGLSRLDQEGAQILTLAATDRIAVKIIVLFAGQTLPEHWHPRVGDDPGKEETVRVVRGVLRCYVPGADTVRAGSAPKGKQDAYTARQEHLLGPGGQITLHPGTKHWFQAGAGRRRNVQLLDRRPRYPRPIHRPEGRESHEDCTQRGAKRMRNERIVASIVLLAVAMPAQADPMVFPGATWEEATPESQGVNSVKLKAAVDYLREHSGSNGVNRLVVVRYGRLIWKGPEADRRQRVWSVTKAFTSTAHGLLMEDGKCTLDTLARDYNPKDLAEHYPTVTLRHLATMTFRL